MVDLRSTKKPCHKNNILKGSCQKKKKKKNLKRQRIDNEKTRDAAYILLLAYQVHTLVM